MGNHFVVVLVALLFSAQSYAWEFGSRGYDGPAGQDGWNGSSGQDVTIQAIGQTQTLNLPGSDGSEGQDGRDGQDAAYCQQPFNIEYNLEGARGGNGGDGGAGGDGGRGGDVTVYTDNIQNLSKITVFSEGGRGARAGRPGNFGRGCRCSYPRWFVRRCFRDGNRDVCQDYGYYCNDGRDGYSGRFKDNGSYGRRGRLLLIPQLSPLPQEKESEQVPFTNLLDTRVNLNLQVWEDKAGATQLFAPGSIISDYYTQFTGMRSYTYTFGWAARRPLADFDKFSISVWARNGEVHSDIDGNLWYDSIVERKGDTYKETITQAMRRSEATQLELGVSGNESTFSAVLTDRAGVSDMLQTHFRIVLKKVRTLIWNKTLFEGEIPDSLVTQTQDQITIRLGQLPDVDPSDLEAGNDVLITLEADRVFAKRQYATQTLGEFRYEIKK